MKADIRWLDDPQVFRVNRLDAHSDHKFYENKDKFHVQLLSLANLKHSQAEQVHHLFQVFRRASRHIAECQNQHSVSRQHSRVIIPDFVHGRFSPTHIRTVHQIIMQQRVVVVHFDSSSRFIDIFEISLN